MTWKEEFLAQAGVQDPAKFPFIVIGNKSDHQNRVITTEQGRQWCRDNGCCYFEASAKDGSGVDEAFIAMARLTLHSQDQLDPRRA